MLDLERYILNLLKELIQCSNDKFSINQKKSLLNIVNNLINQRLESQKFNVKVREDFTDFHIALLNVLSSVILNPKIMVYCLICSETPATPLKIQTDVILKVSMDNNECILNQNMREQIVSEHKAMFKFLDAGGKVTNIYLRENPLSRLSVNESACLNLIQKNFSESLKFYATSSQETLSDQHSQTLYFIAHLDTPKQLCYISINDRQICNENFQGQWKIQTDLIGIDKIQNIFSQQNNFLKKVKQSDLISMKNNNPYVQPFNKVKNTCDTSSASFDLIQELKNEMSNKRHKYIINSNLRNQKML